jgi:nucleoside-diphosphate-sugar epimerase
MRAEPVLATGATGYVGGRLMPQLLAAGYRVRAFGRSFDKPMWDMGYEAGLDFFKKMHRLYETFLYPAHNLGSSH